MNNNKPIISTASIKDEEISQQLKDDLMRNPRIASSLLKVSVADGNAHIEGKVHSLESKQGIEEVLAEYPEIQNVVNDTIIALS